jgi:hypothetical protein
LAALVLEDDSLVPDSVDAVAVVSSFFPSLVGAFLPP